MRTGRVLRALAGLTVLAASTALTGCGESSASARPKEVVQSYRVAGARLAIQLSRPSGVLSPGNDLAYRIQIRNTSGRAYKNVVVNQILPQGLSYWRAKPAPTIENNDQLRWAVDLPARKSKTLLVRGKVTEKATRIQWSATTAMAKLRGDGIPLATTACVSPNAESRITGCTTATNRVLPNTPWYATVWAMLAYVLIVAAVLCAGYIFWYRPRRAADSR